MNNAQAEAYERAKKKHGRRPLRNIASAKYSIPCEVLPLHFPIQFCNIVYPPDIQGFRGNCDERAVVKSEDGAYVCSRHEKQLGWKRKT